MVRPRGLGEHARERRGQRLVRASARRWPATPEGLPSEPSFEVRPDLGPLVIDDAVVGRVAVAAFGQDHVLAEYAFEVRGVPLELPGIARCARRS